MYHSHWSHPPCCFGDVLYVKKSRPLVGVLHFFTDVPLYALKSVPLHGPMIQIIRLAKKVFCRKCENWDAVRFNSPILNHLVTSQPPLSVSYLITYGRPPLCIEKAAAKPFIAAI
jgi:hypothetical protein